MIGAAPAELSGLEGAEKQVSAPGQAGSGPVKSCVTDRAVWSLRLSGQAAKGLQSMERGHTMIATFSAPLGAFSQSA